MPTDATVTNLVVALKALPKSRRTGATFRVTGNILSVYDKEGMALASQSRPSRPKSCGNGP